MHEPNNKFGHFLEKHCSDHFTLNKKRLPKLHISSFGLLNYTFTAIGPSGSSSLNHAHNLPPDVHTFTHARKTLKMPPLSFCGNMFRVRL